MPNPYRDAPEIVRPQPCWFRDEYEAIFFDSIESVSIAGDFLCIHIKAGKMKSVSYRNQAQAVAALKALVESKQAWEEHLAKLSRAVINTSTGEQNV